MLWRVSALTPHDGVKISKPKGTVLAGVGEGLTPQERLWTECWLVMLLCTFAVRGSSRMLCSWTNCCLTVWFLARGWKDLPKKRGFLTFKGTFLSERQTFLLKIQKKQQQRWDSTVNNKEGLMALNCLRNKWIYLNGEWVYTSLSPPALDVVKPSIILFFPFIVLKYSKDYWESKKNLLFSSAFL